MNKFQELISGDTPVLVDFHATWCGPCQTMHPVVDDLKNEFKETLRIIKIDVDKNAALSSKYKVQSVPTFLLFKQGEILWRGAGIQTRSDFIKLIKSKL
ncbi:MAG: thioredoxin [Lishizhenia sp.]